jgi:hypothetical protein
VVKNPLLTDTGFPNSSKTIFLSPGMFTLSLLYNRVKKKSLYGVQTNSGYSLVKKRVLRTRIDGYNITAIENRT